MPKTITTNLFKDVSNLIINSTRLTLKPIDLKNVDDIVSHFTAEITKYMWPSGPKSRDEISQGVWIKKDAHGNKYGLEAVQAIKEWAETNLIYQYLKYPVDKRNMSSRKIPECLGGKIGYEYIKKSESGFVLNEVEYRLYHPTLHREIS